MTTLDKLGARILPLALLGIGACRIPLVDAKYVSAEAFILTRDGHTYGAFGMNPAGDGAQLILSDGKHPRLLAILTESGIPRFGFCDDEGRLRVMVSADDDGGPSILTLNESGDTRFIGFIEDKGDVVMLKAGVKDATGMWASVGPNQIGSFQSISPEQLEFIEALGDELRMIAREKRAARE